MVMSCVVPTVVVFSSTTCSFCVCDSTTSMPYTLIIPSSPPIPNPRRITNSPIESSSCQSQSQIQYSSYPLEFSIKPLTTTFEPHENPSLSRSCSSASIDTMISDLFSSTSSSSASFDSLLMSGDDIGMESCVDVLSDDDLSYSSFHHDCYSQRKERLCWAPEKEKKRTYEELPPPLSLLARTENLPSHMPWVLKRHYTTDGRLILTEEKVRHHEYFRAHRSNGRLRLQLVPLDGQVVNSSTASAGKCRNINTTVRTKSSCIVGVLAPAIRCVKGNTNGSRKGFLGQAGFGGLFRDHAGQVMISAFFDNIGISFTHRAKLAAFIFAMIIAWEKGWLHYGWIQILSWSYLFSLNPFLFFGLCVLSGDIDVI
ncbi:hypothetical protein ACFX14_044434 [Malus domestica]